MRRRQYMCGLIHDGGTEMAESRLEDEKGIREGPAAVQQRSPAVIRVRGDISRDCAEFVKLFSLGFVKTT